MNMQDLTRTETARERPLLLYDGECPFCRRWAARGQKLRSGQVDFQPNQAEACPSAVQLIEPGGRVSSGAEAIFRTLATRRGWRWLPWLYQRLPGFGAVTRMVYRWVARNRHRF